VIVGIGVDVVNVAKFGATVSRTPGFLPTLLTRRERVDESGEPRTVASMAARYAAKEALAKAIGVPPGMDYHDAEVLVEPDGRPYLITHGLLRDAARQLGVRSWHLSMAMEGDVAVAYVVAEGTSTLAGADSITMVEQA
jgi:holo-[acyl-carrier protein] synthase